MPLQLLNFFIFIFWVNISLYEQKRQELFFLFGLRFSLSIWDLQSMSMKTTAFLQGLEICKWRSLCEAWGIIWNSSSIECLQFKALLNSEEFILIRAC